MQPITLSLFALIGIGLALMFFGYFFGLFEGRGQGYKRRKKEEANEKAIQTPLPPPSPPAPIVDSSLLKLSLDESNQPRLDLDGQRVDTSQLTADQRKRLIDLMVTMRPWIEAKPTAAPQPAARPIAAQTPSLSTPRSPSGTMQTPPAAASISQPKPTPVAAAPASKLKDEPPAAPANSMVAQIDTILQKSLIGTPLAERGIRLIESPQGTVAVYVGLTRYNSVGEVTDPQVQAAIKAAIAEWEKKFVPGA
ncbi:MAG: hypothetical protein M1282_01920 [Chloroflexi bacterium]|nr:hypothetical protein [Chloroflexota bacterium]